MLPIDCLISAEKTYILHFLLFFFTCLSLETSETDKEEQQVDKEDKDPWWKPKDLKENLSKGSVAIAFIFS